MPGSHSTPAETLGELGVYFHHCEIEMTCEQLARFGRFLAGFSHSPNLVSRDNIGSIDALMMTSGHYNDSGESGFQPRAV